MCHSCYGSPKHTARMLLRIGFGLSLLFTGVAEYRDPAGFANSVGQGLGYVWLENLGVMWGYVLPLLFILGGLSLIFKVFPTIGTWITGLALISIPAGLMLKSAASGSPLGDTMPPAMNAFIWIIVFMYAVKGMKKRGMCGCGGGCNCGGACSCGGNCACGDKGACPMCGMNPCVCGDKKSSSAKSAMSSAPSASMKSPAKKAPMKKKTPVKKSSSALEEM